MLKNIDIDKRMKFIKNLIYNEGDKLNITKLLNFTGLEIDTLYNMINGIDAELTETQLWILELRLLNDGYKDFYK